MRRKNKGFTLMELMVATAILVIALTALLATFVHCMLLNQSNSNRVIAANDAQYVLEQIKALPYGQISGYINNFNASEVFPDTFPHLQDEEISSPLMEIIDANFANITVQVNWTERQTPRGFSLTTRVTR